MSNGNQTTKTHLDADKPHSGSTPFNIAHAAVIIIIIITITLKRPKATVEPEARHVLRYWRRRRRRQTRSGDGFIMIIGDAIFKHSLPTDGQLLLSNNLAINLRNFNLCHFWRQYVVCENRLPFVFHRFDDKYSRKYLNVFRFNNARTIKTDGLAINIMYLDMIWSHTNGMLWKFHRMFTSWRHLMNLISWENQCCQTCILCTKM